MSDNTKPSDKSSKKWKIGQPVENEDFIHSGEKILWEGKPEDFNVISPQSKRELFVKWLILPILFLITIMLHIRFTDKPNMGLVIGLILLAVILAGTVFLKKKKIMKCRYLLTNERVVMVNRDYAYYIPLSELDGFRVVRNQTVNPTIFFGTAIYKDIDKYLLWRAAADISTDTISGDEASCFNLVFYNLPDAERLITELNRIGLKEN